MDPRIPRLWAHGSATGPPQILYRWDLDGFMFSSILHESSHTFCTAGAKDSADMRTGLAQLGPCLDHANVSACAVITPSLRQRERSRALV